MKVFVGLILSCFVLQALALPTFEDPNAPEHMPKADVEHMPVSERVDAFRAGIESWFVRYQNFYDRSNAAMRNYRFAHVDLITSVYNEMMTVFGDDIEGVRQLAYELNDLIEERTTTLGANNACLQTVVTDYAVVSSQTGLAIQSCATYANTTMTGLITNVFYTAFSGIQGSISTVPTAVIDALSRGNVMQDEEAIIEFLRIRFEVIELQWLSAVSQLLRWETARFETDGFFMVDQMRQCLGEALMQFIQSAAGLQGRARAC